MGRAYGHVKQTVTSGNRVGLVLGAGGTVGCAYHAGVLFSLMHHLEWDARQATSIVGTSAGSLVGGLLRRGVSPEELASLVNGGPVDDVADRLRPLHQASTVATPSTMQVLRSLRPPTPRGMWLSARHRSTRPAMLSMVRPSRFDLADMTRELDQLEGPEWPHGDLRVCTVSAKSGRRRVLTATSDVPLATAVAASCAVPGLFAPQRVAGEWLVDGGMHSVTNVDALPFDDIDEVWVVAPMAGAVFRKLRTNPMHRRIESTLRNELAKVPAGMRVRLFVPGDEASAAMGIDLMSTDRSARTLLAGFLETGDAAARPAA
ncbi:MAG: putative esterase of the alpha-beta hydrolase superfamily [Ilumatobacteraceae bacterium]|nr:putative esterase of the alpha-beta hydrolase superfamily [Ilumatobacteraceae bacterium]